MSLTSIAGVFSRYFVVGFFLPAFFILVGLTQLLSGAFLPNVYEEASPGAQIGILGGLALLLGLLLLALNYPLLRLYEGYPFEERSVFRPLCCLLIKRQRRRFDSERARIASSDEADPDNLDAKWRFDRRFPHDRAELLPTTLGNVIRAFERHSVVRWGFNGIAAWPYVEPLLSDQETQILADAQGEVAFLLNASFLALVSAAIVVADRLTRGPEISALEAFIALAVSALAYHWAVGAGIRWGEVVRAGIDLHRREVFSKLGLRVPVDFDDERLMAWRLTATLLTGEGLPDELAAPPPIGDVVSRWKHSWKR